MNISCDELKARLGQDMRIDIELTTTLPRTASGKFKWVISESISESEAARGPRSFDVTGCR